MPDEQSKEDQIPINFESSSINLRTTLKSNDQDLSMRNALKKSNISIPSVSIKSESSPTVHNQFRLNQAEKETEQLEQDTKITIDEN